MKFTDFASYIRLQTNTDANTFTNTNILLLANIFKDEMAKDIAKRNEDIFGMQYLRNLVASQREYPLPDELLNSIKYVEAKLDGTNWKRLTETDMNREGFITSESGITTQFTGKEPQFEIFRNSLWIYSDSAILDVVDGLKLWALIYPADFTSLASTDDMAKAPSTTSHGFPRQFHELLARRVIIEYKTGRDIPVSLTQNEQRYELDYSRALDAISNMNLDRSFRGSIPYDDGSQY